MASTSVDVRSAGLTETSVRREGGAREFHRGFGHTSNKDGRVHHIFVLSHGSRSCEGGDGGLARGWSRTTVFEFRVAALRRGMFAVWSVMNAWSLGFVLIGLNKLALTLGRLVRVALVAITAT